MKIAVLCNSQALGGLELNVLNLGLWLQEREHEVLFICPPNSPIYQKAEDENIPILTLQSKRKYGNLRATRALAKMLRAHQIGHVIIAHSKDINLGVLVKLFWISKLKLVYLQQMLIGRPKKDFFHTFLYQRLDAWIAPLEIVAQNALHKTKLPPQKIKIIPLCINLEYLLSAQKRKEEARAYLKIPLAVPFAGIIGRIDPQKGQAYLIKALAMLKKKGHPLHILLAGPETKGEEGSYLPYLENLVKELSLDEIVHIRPFLVPKELAFAALDFFVMASEAETFGMVTIEAMATGLPIVGTKAGGTKEILKDQETGLLIPPKDVLALAEALELLMEQPEKSQGLGQQAQKVAQRDYHYTLQAEQTEMMLKAL